jgi:molecular chaperone Hsp33
VSEAPIPAEETGFDRVLHFTLPARDGRGRVLRLGPALDTILGAHDYPAPIRNLLAEALAITALMGSLLKEEDSQLTMQAQAEGGIIDLLVCDWIGGALRGYVRFDKGRLADIGRNPTLAALFGQAYLAITFDLATSKERYQGIVPLDQATLAEACQNYFRQSEQVPTLLRVAVRFAEGHCIAGGLLVQHLPTGEEGRTRLHVELDHPHWAHVAALAGSIRHEELVDPALSLEALVWRLFHEEPEIRVEPGAALHRGCRCNVDYYRSVLARFPADELDAMRNDQGAIGVDCEFCARSFEIDL